jgi:hypothetical protein
MFASTIGETLLSLIIPGVFSILTVFLANKALNRTTKDTNKTDMYKTELEQMQAQRILMSQDNEHLRDALREELEDCRRLRQVLEIRLEELTGKMNTIEAELFAWRNGLRTPGGYVLVKLPAEGKLGG